MVVLGDFHGKFSDKLKSKIEKENANLIVDFGDHFPFHYRDLWFKNSYDTRKPLWEFIGKKKYKQLILKDLIDGEKTLKKINSFKVPVITVVGNIDYSNLFDTFDYKSSGWKWDEQDFFSKIIKKYKNITNFIYSYYQFGHYIFIGAGGHSFPGRVKSKSYRKYRKILDKLFRRFSKDNHDKKVIFISHNVPYKTKLDLVSSEDAHELAKNRHFGSKLIRRAIDKYQPVLHVAGHVHESWGKQKIGKTLCVNPGSISDGRYAVVDLPESKKGKIKVRFVK
jgi:Icc-related predicted phosphoesterase